MSLKFRRVVTGHDAEGRAMVQIDQIMDEPKYSRAGASGMIIWSTQGFPVDNTEAGDCATRKIGTSLLDGSVFRIVRYEPGVSPRIHRTNSVDYGIVLSGEIDLELDGQAIHLRAGDCLVQRGTVHNWINNGAEPCVMLFVLIGARPVNIAGTILHEIG